jgi:hypothetical protein
MQFANPLKTANLVTRKLYWLLLLALTAPCLSFALIRTGWLARLIGVTLFWIIIEILLLLYGFHPKSEFIYAKGKIARIGSDRTKQNARRVIRILVICSAMCVLCFLVVPILTDCFGVIHHGRPYIVQMRGRVAENNIFLFNTLNQNILVVRDGQSSGDVYIAPFFLRIARYGTTNVFLIAPKSKIILDWQPAIDTAPDQVIWR